MRKITTDCGGPKNSNDKLIEKSSDIKVRQKLNFI